MKMLSIKTINKLLMNLDLKIKKNYILVF